MESFSQGTPSLTTMIPAMDYIDTKLTNQACDQKLKEAIYTTVRMAKNIFNKYYKLSDPLVTYCIAMSMYQTLQF